VDEKEDAERSMLDLLNMDTSTWGGADVDEQDGVLG
jgi:hypothetical protein